MLRVSLSSNLHDSSQWVGQVGNTNIPIVTNHASGGTSDTLKIYVFDDGTVEDVNMGLELVYRNLYFFPKGTRTRILNISGIPIQSDATQIPLEDGSLYTQGTKIITDANNLGQREKMVVRSKIGNNFIVDRGKDDTPRLNIPSGTWVESIPDHIFISLTGAEDSFKNEPLKLPDILEPWKEAHFYLRVTTGALKTQIKTDTYFRLSSNEYPKF